MNKTNTNGKKSKWWLMPWALAAGLLLGIPIAAILFLWSGAPDRYLRSLVIEQLSKATGGRVELGGFHFTPGTLHVRLDNLTIHGKELAGVPPFFHADRIEVGVRIDSYWDRKFSVRDVEVMHPSVDIQLARDVSSNVPSPSTPRTPGKPIRERIFEIVVRKLRLDDGEVLFNDKRIPL